MYRVLNWDRHFEGAKSRTYKNKTSCMLPTKHGLGYRRLIRSKDGAALFGAWCALIQVLSRHPATRSGYCTDNGKSDGTPLTAEDFEILTDIPSKYFVKMFEICKSHSVGWVELIKVKDTTGDCEGTLLPLNLDSDSNLNSDLDSDSPSVVAQQIADHYNLNRGLMPKCLSLSGARIKSINARISEHGEDGVIEAIMLARESDFLQGKTDACFKCGIDWVVNKNNILKILEGNYNNKAKKPTTKQELF